MRTNSFALAASFVMLAACGSSQTGQANSGPTGSNFEVRLSLGDVTKIMHERHEGMENIGKNGKAINRQLTGSSPDLAIVRTSAGQIAQLSKQASGWFPEGTGPEAGKTGAKPVIWQQPQDFAVKLHNFQVAAAAFDAAAQTSDVGRIQARFKDMEGTCKACHDTYRSEMHH